MATLDVSDIPVCAEFSDTFQVIRRPETIDYHGRVDIIEAPPVAVLGTIYPTGDNSLVRQSDFERGSETYTCVTPFRLRQAGPGHQPDMILYRGDVFIVTEVEDYSQYG